MNPLKKWYIYRSQTKLGPFEEDQVKAMISIGMLSVEDHGWTAGMAKWQCFSKIAGFTTDIDIPEPPEAPFNSSLSFGIKDNNEKNNENNVDASSNEVEVKDSEEELFDFEDAVPKNQNDQDVENDQGVEIDQNNVKANQKKGSFEDKRKDGRKPFESELIVHDEKKLVYCNALNVSRNGLFMAINEACFDVGSGVQITIRGGDTLKPVHLKGRIVRSHNIICDETSGYGVEFDSPTDYFDDLKVVPLGDQLFA